MGGSMRKPMQRIAPFLWFDHQAVERPPTDTPRARRPWRSAARVGRPLRGLDFALGRGVVGVGDAGKRRRDAGEEHKREDNRSLHPDLPPFLLTVATANTPEAIQRRSDEWTLILRY